MSRAMFFPRSSKRIRQIIENERLKNLEKDTVKWASEQMLKVLAKNRKKGGWRHCTFEYLFFRIGEEMAELTNAVEKFKKDKRTKSTAIKEAIDVMDFAMMIADLIQHDKGA